MIRLFARSATGAAILATAALALAPGAASAKTFSARITDPSGDAASDGVDITSARIAYNRKTGALSGAVTVAGSIDSTADIAVAIALSDFVNGKCYKPILTAGAEFSHPTVSFGERLNSGGVVGKPRLGTASQSDDTMSFRVKDKSLSGKTVGCAVALVMTIPSDGSKPKILDKTTANNGLR